MPCPKPTLQATETAFPDGTLDEWNANMIIRMVGGKTQTIGGTAVEAFDFNSPQGIFSITTFVHNATLITIEAPVSLEENLKIVASILEK